MFQFAEPAAEFPADSLNAEPTAHVIVRYKALDNLAVYSVRTYPEGHDVPVTKSADQVKRVLVLAPITPLPPGRYSATVSSDDPFTGTEYAYFSVGSGSVASVGSPNRE